MPLQIIRQDITKMQVDAIVNTTNEEMIGYSGVDLAVHTVGGPSLDAECAALPPLGLGQAQITGGHGLPCKHVIHTAGPIWCGGTHGESDILRSCYEQSLKLAVLHGCESVAFPLISAGVYGYPKDRVLRYAIQIITDFLFHHELMVYLCVYDKESYTFSQKLFEDIRAFIDDDYVNAREEDYCNNVGGIIAADESFPCERRRVSASIVCADRAPIMPPVSKDMSLREYLGQKDKSFRELLFDLIDASGMTDVACYKRANVDKRIFSKIKSNKDYRPSKPTAIAFAISLRLDLDQTQNLLATAGYTLSQSSTFDKIIRYFIHNKNYDIFLINEALFEFDQTLLGSL